MNTELLEKVAATIVKRPHDFDMSDWVTDLKIDPHGTELFRPDLSCGTTSCIAGWGWVLANGKRRPSLKAQYPIHHEQYSELFGLSRSAGIRLFLVVNWPYKFADRYNSSRTDEERAEVATDRIRHFIVTGGRE